MNFSTFVSEIEVLNHKDNVSSSGINSVDNKAPCYII